MHGLPTRKYSKGDTHALAHSLLTSEEAADAILIFQTSHKRIPSSGSHRRSGTKREQHLIPCNAESHAPTPTLANYSPHANARPAPISVNKVLWETSHPPVRDGVATPAVVLWQQSERGRAYRTQTGKHLLSGSMENIDQCLLITPCSTDFPLLLSFVKEELKMEVRTGRRTARALLCSRNCAVLLLFLGN